MLNFLVILLCTVVERFVGGVGDSSNRTGLMEFAFGRPSDTSDIPVFSVATRNITRQHLFRVKTSILEKGKKTNAEIPPQNHLNSISFLPQKKKKIIEEKCEPCQCPRLPDCNKE